MNNVITYDYPFLAGGSFEQREFGYWTTNVARPVRATVGKARRTVANKFYQAANKAKLEHGAVIDKLTQNGGLPSVQNKGLRNKILSVEAPKAKTTVSFRTKELVNMTSGGGVIPTDPLSKTELGGYIDRFGTRNDKKFLKKLYGKDRYKSGIVASPGVGVEALAHELGHAQGRSAKGLRGYISRTDPRDSGRGMRIYAPASRSKVSTGKRVGFGQALKDTVSNIRNSGHIIAEETAASRSGLQMMKRHGATKEELARASENLGLAGRTYKLGGKSSVLSSLGRLVDIPTRRG